MGRKSSVKDKKCCGCGTFKIIYGDKKRFYCENCVSVVGEFQSNPAKTGD